MHFRFKPPLVGEMCLILMNIFFKAGGSTTNVEHHVAGKLPFRESDLRGFKLLNFTEIALYGKVIKSCFLLQWVIELDLETSKRGIYLFVLFLCWLLSCVLGHLLHHVIHITYVFFRISEGQILVS